MIPPGARVLDVGCGDGALLEYLVHELGADGRGIELSQAGVNACVARGLSVIQGDADTDLKDYPSDAFDVAVLSQTLQATRAPRKVLGELVRIGRRAIVSFPNFGHWRVRWRLFYGGRMPNTPSLPDEWYATPNIHLCTILDFEDLADDQLQEVLAFAWVGQGTYDAADWDEAMEAAAEESNIVDELMDMPMLASVLEAGLAAFDLNCDGIGDLS